MKSLVTTLLFVAFFCLTAKCQKTPSQRFIKDTLLKIEDSTEFMMALDNFFRRSLIEEIKSKTSSLDSSVAMARDQKQKLCLIQDHEENMNVELAKLSENQEQYHVLVYKLAQLNKHLSDVSEKLKNDRQRLREGKGQ